MANSSAQVRKNPRYQTKAFCCPDFIRPARKVQGACVRIMADVPEILLLRDPAGEAQAERTSLVTEYGTNAHNNTRQKKRAQMKREHKQKSTEVGSV